ncbi:MAG: hypothetical protein AAF065_06685 [Verrucomicrobiota bacterium]
MDIDIHQPGQLPTPGIGGSGDTLPPKIPEAEQLYPSRCPILVNDDNDDLDWVKTSPHPKLSYV